MGGGAGKGKKYDASADLQPTGPTRWASYVRAGDAPFHVAIVGAGFVGTNTAFMLLAKGISARLTLTDVNEEKCQGEVWDLQDGGGAITVATPQEAGQADIIVITAGRGQKEGETRLDLLKANSAIMRSVIAGMQPIKNSAKVIIVSNPCDVLTYVAQECANLPYAQVFGSGTVLDTLRLRQAISETLEVHVNSINLWVLGEHGDSQFPVTSLANVGGVPLMDCKRMQGVDLTEMAKKTASKAYDIISKKGHTAFGVAQAVERIVDSILNDKKIVMPVSTRVPGRRCCLSLPCVVTINGIDRVLDYVEHYFDKTEKQLYVATIERMESAIASIS